MDTPWTGTDDQVMQLAHAQFGQNISVSHGVEAGPGWFRVCRFDDTAEDDEGEMLGWVTPDGRTDRIRNYKNSRYFDYIKGLTWEQV